MPDRHNLPEDALASDEWDLEDYGDEWCWTYSEIGTGQCYVIFMPKGDRQPNKADLAAYIAATPDVG